MIKKKKIIILLSVTVFLGLAGYTFYYYLLTFTPVVVRFNDDVTKEEAVQIVAKYDESITTRRQQLYNNPFFCFLDPFERSHGIEFEAPRGLGAQLKKRLLQEDGVQKVIDSSNTYDFAREHPILFEKNCAESRNASVSPSK